MPSPLDVADAIARAHAALRAGNPTEAERVCASVLVGHPANVDAALILGIISARRGEVVSAIERLRGVAELDPRCWEALDWLCVLLRRVGAVKEATEFGLRATELRPQAPESWGNLGHCYLATAHFDDALKCFDKAVAANPAVAAAHHNRGVALQRLGRTAEAESAYRRAIDLDRGAPQSLVSLAGLLQAEADAAAIEACLDQAAARVAGSPAGMRAFAQALREQGFFVRAEAALRSIVGTPGATAEDLVQLAQV